MDVCSKVLPFGLVRVKVNGAIPPVLDAEIAVLQVSPIFRVSSSGSVTINGEDVVPQNSLYTVS